MKKLTLLHLTFVIVGNSILGQGFVPPFNWSAGDAIGAVGTVDIPGRTTIPISNNILAAPSSTIDFSVRFTDFDRAVCGDVTPTAIANNRVGFGIRQRYVCSPPASFGTTNIYRRVNGITGNVELRKQH